MGLYLRARLLFIDILPGLKAEDSASFMTSEK
jgi:hypothetical protein